RLGGVIPSRDEEYADAGAPDPDRLLLDAADRRDGAVELDLARRRDAPPVIDVAAELLEHVEREREPGRRTADRAGVDLHLDRQLDECGLVDEDPDQRVAWVCAIGDRPDDD